MNLYPQASPFFSCSSISQSNKRNLFLSRAKENFSFFDYNLFYSILLEWESSPLLHSCFSVWKKFVRSDYSSIFSPVHVLLFNVRGLDTRWQEVLLLISSFNTDILILLETGEINLSLYFEVFSNFTIFFQSGENKNGGVLVLTRNGIVVKRVDCAIPNVCVIDLSLDENIRIVGVYAPVSRSWTWKDLSPFISDNCVIYGDFNVDLELDAGEAEGLLNWADSLCLSPFVPDGPTSLRSERTIDFAFSNNIKIDIQEFNTSTTSDHRPVSSVLSLRSKQPVEGKSTHWKVFNLFTEYTYSYWEKVFGYGNVDISYDDYIHFLHLLTVRCTIYFPLNKYRIAIPPSLRCFMSYVRALSLRHLRTKDIELKKQVCYLRKIVKNELQLFVSSQLSSALHLRHTTSPISVSFWSKAKRFIKPSSSSLNGFISSSGEIVKDPHEMCDQAADFYENLFRKTDNIIRPHPYVDAPLLDFDNKNDPIPEVFIEELIETVYYMKKKKSLDAHGLSSFMFSFLHDSHWLFLLGLYNLSFSSCVLPRAWNDTRILLLAKKDSVCPPSLTRPISLLDCFRKVGEKLFLSRFRKVLVGRGLLPNNQSGFRDRFRLQTRVLLFLDDLYSYMSNSAPSATLFVDFKNAFDMLWHEGCVGKFEQMGIPLAFTKWIYAWLVNRRGYIEVNGVQSRWFSIEKGGPQGSSLTPLVFISYHADLPEFLSWSTSHLFADDLAAIVSAQIGIQYTEQCLDLQKRLRLFLDQLEYYCLLTVQPINFNKTEGLWSTRAVGSLPFDIEIGGNQLKWAKEFKYLGYVITPKLGWGQLIHRSMLKIRQRLVLINSFRFFGKTSAVLRRTLFSSYVLPLFTWLYPVLPLFSDRQCAQISHFYFTCLKRILFCLGWNDSLFAYVFDEMSLTDRCIRYWDNYLIALSSSIDGEMLLDRATLSFIRQSWVEGYFSIKGLRVSQRYVENKSVLERCMKWISSHPYPSSVPDYDMEELHLLRIFPDSFFS